MNSVRAIIAVGTAMAAVGVWWILPGSKPQRRALGGLLCILALGLLGSQVPGVGDLLARGMFIPMALVTIVAAVATISCRSPVYCAIWFGMTLAGTAGLFLLAGAEFLAIATIVVYAGAILVTFLFVLMLSEPEGHTTYDRRSWEAMLSAFTGAVLVGILTTVIGSAVTQAKPSMPKAAPPSISEIGAILFTQHMVAVEAAGALLFAALVGAAVIVAQGLASMKRAKPVPPAQWKGDAPHVS